MSKEIQAAFEKSVRARDPWGDHRFHRSETGAAYAFQWLEAEYRSFASGYHVAASGTAPIARAVTSAPTERGWYFGRHHKQQDFPIEPHKVMQFANGLGVPNGGGFTDVADFHWFGPVPSVQPQQ